MTNEEIKVQLNLIEKIIKEGFEKLNQRMAALEAGFESNQERFDVLEEHVVMLVEDMGEIKKRQDRLEKAIMEHDEKTAEK